MSIKRAPLASAQATRKLRDIERPPPLVTCSILGESFRALFVSGATYSQGSTRLYQLCLANKIPLVKENVPLVMADGTVKPGRQFSAVVPLSMGGRTVHHRFLIFPDSDGQLLIGHDFMYDYRVMIDCAACQWWYHDARDECFSFDKAEDQDSPSKSK